MAWQYPSWHSPPPPGFIPPVYDLRYTPGVYIPPPPPWMTPQSPGGLQQPPHHYGSPNAGGSTAPAGTTGTLSPSYPQLHPALAPDTTLVRFDVRQPPSQSITPEWFQTNRSHSAFSADPNNGARPARVRLLCKHPAAPWSIEIKAAPHAARETGVTCEDIWGGIYAALQQPIADSEWGFIVKDKAVVDTVNNSIKKRLRSDPGASKHPLRIDCLGDAVLFRGMDKDDEYAKVRLMPTAEKCAETWVIRLTN